MAAVAVAGSGAATMFARQARTRRARAKPSVMAVSLVGLFVVVVLVAGLAAAAGNLISPKVRPAAVLLLGRPARVLCGIYVGQTSDRLYIGEIVQQDNDDLGDHRSGQLIEVARARVGGLVIGTAQPLDDALKTSVRPVARIRALHGEGSPDQVDVDPSAGCFLKKKLKKSGRG